MKRMRKYRCKVCQWVYSPENGDPKRGINPGTEFEQLPADWHCPICQAGKEHFEIYE